MAEHTEHTEHIVSPAVYLLIFGALMVLTFTTVTPPPSYQPHLPCLEHYRRSRHRHLQSHPRHPFLHARLHSSKRTQLIIICASWLAIMLS